jgi:ATP-binding cassette, subfamily B, bacterial
MLQMSQVECGATCLAMVLSAFGRATRIADLRAQCGAGRDGATAQLIAQAARAHGLRVKAVSLEPAQFRHVPLPAIVHWEFNHFVVVERWSRKWVEIVDPAMGRRRLTAAEFDDAFTGVVLAMEPGAHFEPRKATGRRPWRNYLAAILSTRGARGLLLQVLGASLLLQVFGLAPSVVTAVLIDHVLPFGLTSLLPLLGVGIGVLVLTQLATTYLRSALLIYLQRRLDARMMLGFFEHLLALPFQFFAQRSSGDLLMRLGSNTLIRELLTGQTIGTFLDGTLVVTYLAILLTRDASFGLLVLGLGVIHAALVLAPTRRVHRLTQRHLIAQAASQSYLFEALSGIATLKASGAEDRALDRWSDLFATEMNIALERSQLSALVDAAMAALRVLSPLLLLWVGAQRVLDGTLSLGAMLALSALAGTIFASLMSLLGNVQLLQVVGANLERLDDVLEAEPEQDQSAVAPAPRLSGRIELRDVSFRYDPTGPWVLRNISLTIEPGQKVALVGSTGSGKSTLGMLLLGLYPPPEGEVLFDGVPLRRLNYRTLRSQFGVVLQDPFLFSDSIRHNIAFSDPGLALEGVEAAARRAGIHDDIARMPMSYETLVGQGGAGLSGGQVQRIAIARALAHDPAVLLLDEATSHLDTATERVVDKNLSELSCTRIVIAHRLSTVRNADLILVMDKGQLVERGTHQELLSRGGRYTALVTGQMATEAERTAPAATPWRLRFCTRCGLPARVNARYCVGCGQRARERFVAANLHARPLSLQSGGAQETVANGVQGGR